jgi:(hydroxyamino)benzene mutase
MTDTVAEGSSSPAWSPVSEGASEGASQGAGVPELRHPFDPDQARSTKAAAVLALGIAAVVTGPVVGGVVPATVGLALARQARADLAASQGYLTGWRQLKAGVVLAWIGIGLALATLVVFSVLGIIGLADGGLHDFPDTSD